MASEDWGGGDGEIGARRGESADEEADAGQVFTARGGLDAGTDVQCAGLCGAYRRDRRFGGDPAGEGEGTDGGEGRGGAPRPDRAIPAGQDAPPAFDENAHRLG